MLANLLALASWLGFGWLRVAASPSQSSPVQSRPAPSSIGSFRNRLYLCGLRVEDEDVDVDVDVDEVEVEVEAC